MSIYAIIYLSTFVRLCCAGDKFYMIILGYTARRMSDLIMFGIYSVKSLSYLYKFVPVGGIYEM